MPYFKFIIIQEKLDASQALNQFIFTLTPNIEWCHARCTGWTGLVATGWMHCLDFLVINYFAAMKLIQFVLNNYVHLLFWSSLGSYYLSSQFDSLLLYLTP